MKKLNWAFWGKLAGGLAGFSLVFYAFTGMGFWAPLPDHDTSFRGPAIVLVHLLGLVWCLIAVVEG